MFAAHQEGGSQLIQETSVRLALAGLARLDHATELAWPYGNPAWPADRPSAAMEAGNRRPLPGWRELPALSADALSAQLDLGNPLILTVQIVWSAWNNARGAIDAASGKVVRGNHAVVVVGAEEDAGGMVTRFIIKNSWGALWGDAGYGFLSRRYMESYAVRCHALEAS